MPATYCVDLGTCNLKIYNKQTGRTLVQKNTIAILNEDQLFACGNKAYDMYEKAPDTIAVTFPISAGVIAEYNHMQMMIQEILEDTFKGHVRGSNFVISVPTDITEVEKKAFYDLFYKSKMRPHSVLLCDKPIADGIGLGLDVNEPIGAMIVDMGADTTEISVVSLGGLVLSELSRFGGNRLDEAIVSYVKKKYNLVIGKRTACQLKEKLGSALPDPEGFLPVVGLDVVSGIPIELEIDATVVYDAIKEHISSFCATIKSILERTPPEVSKDIIYNGIYLTGGTSRIPGLDRLLTGITNIAVNVAEEPEETVVKGLGLVASSERYRQHGYTLRPRVFR